MSIKAMTWVWEHSDMDGPRLLLLLALADYANDEGTQCYPSIKTLARRCRRSDRRTQALLRELDAVGEIAIEVGSGAPSAHGPTNRYVLRRYRDAVGLSSPSTARPEGAMTPTGVIKPAGVMKSAPVTKSAPQGCQNQHPRGDEIVTLGGDETVTPGVMKLSPNPSVEPLVEPPKEPPRVAAAAAAAPADLDPPATATMDAGAARRSRQKPPTATVAKSTPVWDAYAQAFNDRHHAAPVRNGQVNAQLCRFVELVGARDAPAIAAYYVTLNKRFYVENDHPIWCLVKDYQSIRKQWLTGMRTTSTYARHLDQRQESVNILEELKAMYRQEGTLLEEGRYHAQ